MPGSPNSPRGPAVARRLLPERAVWWVIAVGMALAVSAMAAPLDDVLARVISAYGGEAAIPKSKCIRQTGVTYSALRGAEGPIVRAFRPPDRLRIEIRYPDATEVRLMAGPHAWKESRPMNGVFREALLLQARRLGLPWNLLEARDALRDAGEAQTREGTTLRILAWSIGPGTVMEIGIEPETGRIVRTLGKITGNMGVMEFGTTYEDFRHRDGRLYPAMERHFAMGQPTGYTRIEQVEYLDALPDSLFLPAVPGPEEPGQSRQLI